MTLNHPHLAFDQLLKTHSLGFLTEMHLLPFEKFNEIS